jgi:hypothetical protein
MFEINRYLLGRSEIAPLSRTLTVHRRLYSKVLITPIDRARQCVAQFTWGQLDSSFRTYIDPCMQRAAPIRIRRHREKALGADLSRNHADRPCVLSRRQNRPGTIAIRVTCID